MSGRKMSVSQRRDLIVAIFILAAVTIFACFQQADGIGLQFGDDGIILTGPEEAEFTVEVKYADILSISEADGMDVGTNLSGICTKQCWYGRWRNDTFGEYTLCAQPFIGRYIVLETTKGVVVCNYESKDTTRGLYTALLGELEAG